MLEEIEASLEFGRGDAAHAIIFMEEQARKSHRRHALSAQFVTKNALHKQKG